jgi:hypothetical protein
MHAWPGQGPTRQRFMHTLPCKDDKHNSWRRRVRVCGRFWLGRGLVCPMQSKHIQALAWQLQLHRERERRKYDDDDGNGNSNSNNNNSNDHSSTHNADVSGHHDEPDYR